MKSNLIRKRSSIALVSLLVLAIVALPSGAGAAAGDLDPSFGAGGKVVTDFGEGDQALGIALQPNGKAVAAGFSFESSSDFVLARYQANGSLDPMFDGDGKVRTDLGGYDFANAVVFQPGKLLAVGGTNSCCPNNRIAIARYLLDGSLDPTLDQDGMLTVGLTAQGATGSDVVLQPDGKIVVAGTVDFNGDFVVVRFNPDGTLDSTFDGDGWARTDFGLDDRASAIALQKDGRIVLAGVTDDNAPLGPGVVDFAVARYNSDGSPDSTFDQDGKVTVDFGGVDSASDLALQADGKIVVAGSTDDDFGIVRLNTDGSLDTQGLDRYMDAPFGANGKVTTDFAGGLDHATSIAIEPSGKIVVAGLAGPAGNADFGLARYHVDGRLDSSFGTGGKTTTSFTAGDDFPVDVAIERDGRILLAGDAGDNTDTRDFALARYLASGCCSTGGEPPGAPQEPGPLP